MQKKRTEKGKFKEIRDTHFFRFEDLRRAMGRIAVLLLYLIRVGSVMDLGGGGI